MHTPPNVPPPVAAPAAPTAPPRRNRALWWVGGALALTMVVCLAAALGGNRDTDNKSTANPGDTGHSADEADGTAETETEEPDGIGAGTWEVGSDIDAGTYVTTAPGDGALDGCYWARLSGFSGEFDELIANDNISGGARGRVTINEDDAGVEFSGDCRWLPASDDTDVPAGDEVSAGFWEVGTEIEPGTYTTTAPGDGALDGCYWARLSGFSGEFSDLIANDNISGGTNGRVEISGDDAGIEFSGDCIWTRS